MKQKTVKACPNCGSREINIITLTGAGPLAFGLPQKYYCHNCTYTGLPIEGTEKQLSKLEFRPKRIKKTRKVKEESDFVRAVSILTILAFFILAIMMFLPGQLVETVPGASIIAEDAEVQTPAWTAVTDYNPEGHDVLRATGASSVQAFMFPLFMLFFTLGILALGIYSHWHRMRLFE